MILVTFAGTRDPIAYDTPEEGSIVTLCRYLASRGETVDALWILSMDVVGRRHAQDTQEWLALEGLFHADHMHLVHQEGNPADHVAVTQFVFAVVQSPEFRRSSAEMAPIAFNGTSGTPAMKMSGFLLSIAGLLHGGQVWTVANPTFVAEGSRVVPAHLDFVREHILREQIRTAVHGSQFDTALNITREWVTITVHEGSRQVAGPVEHVLRAYQAQDLANYAEAKTQMMAIPDAQVFRDVTAQTVFRAQRRWLANADLSAPTENALNLVEILFAIARYQTQERYTDALARCRRLFEGIVYWYYQAHYQIDVRQPVSRWEEAWHAMLNRDHRSDHGTSLWALAEHVFPDWVETSETTAWHEEKTMLRQMMDTRNHSLAAHGMQPVLAKDVSTVYPIVKKLLVAAAPKTTGYILDYPLTQTKRQRVLQGLGL